MRSQATYEKLVVLNGNLNMGNTSPVGTLQNGQVLSVRETSMTAVVKQVTETSDKGNYKIFTYPLSSPFFKMEKIMQVSDTTCEGILNGSVWCCVYAKVTDQ